MKTESYHNANFFIKGGTCSATSDDKGGIITTQFSLVAHDIANYIKSC